MLMVRYVDERRREEGSSLSSLPQKHDLNGSTKGGRREKEGDGTKQKERHGKMLFPSFARRATDDTQEGKTITGSVQAGGCGTWDHWEGPLLCSSVGLWLSDGCARSQWSLPPASAA